jgi:hypothetical protein
VIPQLRSASSSPLAASLSGSLCWRRTLVATELERRWNKALKLQAQIEEELVMSDPPHGTDAAHASLRGVLAGGPAPCNEPVHPGQPAGTRSFTAMLEPLAALAIRAFAQ